MSTSRTKLPMLPSMQCDEGCTACCSKPFPISETELVDVLAYANEHGIEPRSQGALCPFYHDGRCAVYEARPLICDLFGHMPDMRHGCERGYDTHVADPAPYRAELASKGPALRFMHEALARPAFDSLAEWASLVFRVDQIRLQNGMPPLSATHVLRPTPEAPAVVIMTANHAA